MSLYLDAAGYFRSVLLDQFEWLEHGFGTARASLPGTPLTLQQIHSSHPVHSSEWVPACEGDALISSQSGVQVAVKTADCVPVLLADVDRKIVAAVHAGWRGTVKGIVRETLAKMAKEHGTTPESVVAAIGPGIGACCFEVGPEVAREFRSLFPERHDLGDRTTVDLAEANRRILIQCGVLNGNISDSAPCTVCSPEYFHSWRRDRQTGARMYSAIGIVA